MAERPVMLRRAGRNPLLSFARHEEIQSPRHHAFCRITDMNHSPVESEYLTDFVAHEEKQGNERFFPSTAELPQLARALRLEFESMLPPRIKQTDARGSGLRKIERKAAAEIFCDVVNGSRTDNLQLFHLLDNDLVAHPAIVQHVFRDDREGTSLSFRFYVRDGFFEEIRLCGRRLSFAKHAFERFYERSRKTGNVIKSLIKTVFLKPMVLLPCGGKDKFGIFVSLEDSLFVLPIREQSDEFLVQTFLNIDTTYSLETGLPAYPVNLHYGTTFTPPKIRNWDPVSCVNAVKDLFDSKAQPVKQQTADYHRRWGELAQKVPDLVKNAGHGPGSRLVFLDNIPGPCCLQIGPQDTETSFDELAYYTKHHPDRDWAAILAKRDAMFTKP